MQGLIIEADVLCIDICSHRQTHLSELPLELRECLVKIIMLDLVCCWDLLLVGSKALKHVVHLACLAGDELAVIQLLGMHNHVGDKFV